MGNIMFSVAHHPKSQLKLLLTIPTKFFSTIKTSKYSATWTKSAIYDWLVGCLHWLCDFQHCICWHYDYTHLTTSSCAVASSLQSVDVVGLLHVVLLVDDLLLLAAVSSLSTVFLSCRRAYVSVHCRAVSSYLTRLYFNSVAYNWQICASFELLNDFSCRGASAPWHSAPASHCRLCPRPPLYAHAHSHGAAVALQVETGCYIHASSVCVHLHCECHPNHGYNFVNSWLICKILSLLQRALHFQQNLYYITHQTSSMLLHYLGKLFALFMHVKHVSNVTFHHLSNRHLPRIMKISAKMSTICMDTCWEMLFTF